MRQQLDNVAGRKLEPTGRPSVVGRSTRRTIYINVFPEPEDHYSLVVHSHDLPGGAVICSSEGPTKVVLNEEISRLRRAWSEEIFGYGNPLDSSHPLADTHDLTKHRGTKEFDEAIRQLALRGYELFESFFLGCERSDLALLKDVLRSPNQAITVVSKDLIIPWSMLYLPCDDSDLYEAEAPWSYDGFFGNRHLVEHTFRERPRNWKPQIKAHQDVWIGAYADTGIEVTGPVLEFLAQTEAAKVFEHTTKGSLAQAFSTIVKDHVMVFCCHGFEGTPSHAPYLELSDAREITSADFTRWLKRNALAGNPVVFMLACHGGQLAPLLYSAFGRTFLQYGANCLIGPQIEIPQTFGHEYSCRFLSRLFAGELIGDIVLDLSRQFASQFNNPFGLVMSLYRGMDSYIDRTTAAAPESSQLNPVSATIRQRRSTNRTGMH